MRGAGTVIEIWSNKDYGDDDVDLLGTRDVIGRVTIGRYPIGNQL